MRDHLQPDDCWETLRAEQLLRWRNGEHVTVEELVGERAGRVSSLNDDGLLDLIYGELLLREEAGEQPTANQFIGRFPRLAREIERQFTVHEALSESSLWESPVAESGRLDRQTPDHAEKSPDMPPTLPPEYEWLGEIGRGGMGIVYKVRHRVLKRHCALKMLRDRALADAGRRDRFRAEAEAVARLKHPNIVQIYDCGEFAGVPYLSLEYLDEGTLESWTRPPLRPVDDCVSLVETLAHAVGYAHDQGIIHRDLKPANILLGSAGQSVKITDFGLAKCFDSDANLTQSETILGTAAYLAPEQAWGRSSDVGPRTDVHALGVLLYELLTGVSPFGNSSFVKTLDLVRFHIPCAPSALRADVPSTLDAVCLRCLEKEPSQRYASAREFAADLRRVLAREPVTTRSYGDRPSVPALATRWRLRMLVTSIVAAAITIAVLASRREDLSGSSWLNNARSVKPSVRTEPSTFAFLVGVRAYGVGDNRFELAYTEADVDELSRVLLKLRVPRENIQLLTQWSEADNPELSPTAENIRRRLKQIVSNTIPGDSILVAVTGMGGESGPNGEYCYLPASAQLDRPQSLIPLSEFYEMLSLGRASRRILLVDTCQSTPLPDLGLASRSPPPNVAVLFACAPGEASIEHDRLRHGVFSYQILRGLEGEADVNRDGIVAIGELHDFAVRGVRDFLAEHAPNALQTPTFVGDLDKQQPIIGPFASR